MHLNMFAESEAAAVRLVEHTLVRVKPPHCKVEAHATTDAGKPGWFVRVNFNSDIGGSLVRAFSPELVHRESGFTVFVRQVRLETASAPVTPATPWAQLWADGSSLELAALLEVLEIAMIGTYDEVQAADDVGRKEYGRKVVSEVIFQTMLPSVALRRLRGDES